MITTPSGLQYEDTTVGTGAEARKGQHVHVHYTGWLYNCGPHGGQFASSRARNAPFAFSLGPGMVSRGRAGAVLQILDDLRVGLENLLSLVVGHRRVEAARGVHRRHRDDALDQRVAVLRAAHRAGAALLDQGGADELEPVAGLLRRREGRREQREREEEGRAHHASAPTIAFNTMGGDVLLSRRSVG